MFTAYQSFALFQSARGQAITAAGWCGGSLRAGAVGVSVRRGMQLRPANGEQYLLEDTQHIGFCPVLPKEEESRP